MCALTRIRHICWPHDPSDLFHTLQIRTQTPVHGEDFLVDDRSDWKTVETIGEGLPKFDIVSPLACIHQ